MNRGCEIARECRSAAPLVQLAHARALREDWVQPAGIEPIYLREPDALINWSIGVVALSTPR